MKKKIKIMGFATNGTLAYYLIEGLFFDEEGGGEEGLYQRIGHSGGRVRQGNSQFGDPYPAFSEYETVSSYLGHTSSIHGHFFLSSSFASPCIVSRDHTSPDSHPFFIVGRQLRLFVLLLFVFAACDSCDDVG